MRTAIKSIAPVVNVVKPLNNPVMSALLAQISGNNVKGGEWARRYGPTHEAVLRVQYENAQVRQSMISELQRIAQVYKNDLDVAKSQETTLAASLEQMKSAAYSTNLAQVKLRELQRDADSYRNLYQSFLDRY